ncbi:hypothetical protein CLM62_10145 [Streptomyces sp. SA15]|uniref:hypothetical protein n=1 Tax=Streptomyces sp. SA15 TaxID=934019 RepID=UPI000BAF1969|nr:hypothetical protein [Streptomyces sp. SA15]PAZ16038.1 hypothetical protein CLM62_10145 [Streptomyces sp. SA15]
MPEGEHDRVLDALVYAYQPFGGGPHFAGGTLRFKVEVPPNTMAETRSPTGGGNENKAPGGAKFEGRSSRV